MLTHFRSVCMCVLRAIEATPNTSENVKLVFHEFRNLVYQVRLWHRRFHIVFIAALASCIFFNSPPSLTSETILFYESIRVHSTFNPYKCRFSLCIVALKMMAQSAWNPLTYKSTFTCIHADERTVHTQHRWLTMGSNKEATLETRKKSLLLWISECELCACMCAALKLRIIFMIHSRYYSGAFGYVL